MEDKSCKTPRWRMLKNQLNNLSTSEFKEMIEADDEAIVVDVRTAKEFALHHIPGAINIDYLSEGLWDKIEALSAKKNYYIYCRSGRRSIRVCTLMRNGGFDNERLFNLSPGYTVWLDDYPEVIESQTVSG